jgi:hypothetical protein
MPWTNLPTDQRDYVRDIEANLAGMRRKVTPATLYKTSAPTADDIAVAWSNKYPPAYSPDSYEMAQWVDPSSNTLSNTYAQFGAIAGQQRLTQFPEGSIPYTRLAEIYIDDGGGVATQLFSNISQAYNHLCCYVNMRDSVAAASANVTVRINGSASAAYAYSFQAANNTTSLGTEQVGQTGFLLPTPGNTSHRGFYHEGLFWIYDYALTTRPVRVHHRGVYLTGATPNAAASNNVNGFGIFNSLAAVTSLSFVSATGFVAGTRFVLFGV